MVSPFIAQARCFASYLRSLTHVQELGTPAQIRASLAELGKGTVEGIADHTGLNSGTVGNELRRMAGEVKKSGKEGHADLWSLREPEP